MLVVVESAVAAKLSACLSVLTASVSYIWQAQSPVARRLSATIVVVAGRAVNEETGMVRVVSFSLAILSFVDRTCKQSSH